MLAVSELFSVRCEVLVGFPEHLLVSQGGLPGEHALDLVCIELEALRGHLVVVGSEGGASEQVGDSLGEQRQSLEQ